MTPTLSSVSPSSIFLPMNGLHSRNLVAPLEPASSSCVGPGAVAVDLSVETLSSIHQSILCHQLKQGGSIGPLDRNSNQEQSGSPVGLVPLPVGERSTDLCALLFGLDDNPRRFFAAACDQIGSILANTLISQLGSRIKGDDNERLVSALQWLVGLTSARFALFPFGWSDEQLDLIRLCLSFLGSADETVCDLIFEVLSRTIQGSSKIYFMFCQRLSQLRPVESGDDSSLSARFRCWSALSTSASRSLHARLLQMESGHVEMTLGSHSMSEVAFQTRALFVNDRSVARLDLRHQSLPASQSGVGDLRPTPVEFRLVLEQLREQVVTPDDLTTLREGKLRSALTYGEAMPSFIDLLIQRHGISAVDRFVDIGAGIGTVVLQVAALTGASAVGIELRPELVAIGRRLIREFRRIAQARSWSGVGQVELLAGNVLCDRACVARLQLDRTRLVFANNFVFPAPLDCHIFRICAEQFQIDGSVVIVTKQICPRFRLDSERYREQPLQAFAYPWQTFDAGPDSISWSSSPISYFVFQWFANIALHQDSTKPKPIPTFSGLGSQN